MKTKHFRWRRQDASGLTVCGMDNPESRWVTGKGRSAKGGMDGKAVFLCVFVYLKKEATEEWSRTRTAFDIIIFFQFRLRKWIPPLENIIIVLKRKPRSRSDKAGENFGGLVEAYGLFWLHSAQWIYVERRGRRKLVKENRFLELQGALCAVRSIFEPWAWLTYFRCYQERESICKVVRKITLLFLIYTCHLLQS